MTMVQNKVVLITGGGGGIGRATAISFSRQGALAIVMDYNLESADTVAQEIQRAGGKALAVCADVASPAQVEAAFDQVRSHTEKLDVLVNCAGVCIYKYALTLDDSEWERCLNIDLKGVWLCCKHGIPMMIAAGSGSIINIASTHAVRAQGDAFPYGVAKGGLISLTRSLAVDFGKYGIRVNAVCPGLVHSSATLDYFEGHPNLTVDQMISLQPLSVKILPEDVANAIMFLASDMARCITGTALFIDAGRTVYLNVRHDSQ